MPDACLCAEFRSPPFVDGTWSKARIFRYAVLLKLLKECGEPGRPGFLERHRVHPSEFYRDIAVGKIIDMKRDDEVSQFLAAREGLCQVDFPQSAVPIVGGARQDEKNLGGASPQYFFDVVPENLTAKQLGQIAPDVISLPRELKREPLRELVIFWIGMAYKKDVALLVVLCFQHCWCS